MDKIDRIRQVVLEVFDDIAADEPVPEPGSWRSMEPDPALETVLVELEDAMGDLIDRLRPGFAAPGTAAIDLEDAVARLYLASASLAPKEHGDD